MKKKIILLVLTISLLVFTTQRIYWYYNNDCNNLIFILSNFISCEEEEKENLNIEVYIDNKLYYKSSSFSEAYIFVCDKSISIGYHRLKVIINSHFIATEDFFVFPMKWIIIECWGFDCEVGDVTIWFDSSPPGLM